MPARPTTVQEDSHHVRIKYLEAELQSFKKEILGNGQPGKLARMEARTINAMGEFASRLKDVEKKVGRLVILIAGLSAAVGGGSTTLIRALIGG